MLRPQPLLHKYYTARQVCAKHNIWPLALLVKPFHIVFFTQHGVPDWLDVVYSANQQFVATVMRVSVP
jgi:hypothetical protein